MSKGQEEFGESKDDGSASDVLLHFKVVRPALTVDARHRHFSYEAPTRQSLDVRIKNNLKKRATCSRKNLLNILHTRLPFLQWLLKYDLKNWLVPDIIAGLTMAVCHIPIGIGYTLVAEVPAIHGIYTAFYPVLVYCVLGTSRHVSMGPFAIITVMIGQIVRELATFPPEHRADGTMAENMTESYDPITESLTEAATNMATNLDAAAETYTPIQIATLLSFMIGAWQVLFGFLKLGPLTMFIPDIVISGLTTGAVFHIIGLQVNNLLGLNIRPPKIFALYYLPIEIYKRFNEINTVSVVISALTLTVLVLNYKCIMPIVASKTSIPVPIELIIMVVGTAVVHFGALQEPYDIKILGQMPTGFPPPSIPPLELFRKVALESFFIALCSYIISFCMGRRFALRSGEYKVKATQELFAQGFSNLFGSFFSCVPMTGAPSRTIIQFQSGGKTQMTSLISCAVLLFVILFFGPLLESLPKAIFAMIICFSWRPLFFQFFEMIAVWKISKMDACAWLVTFFGVIMIQLRIGLLMGIVFSLLVLLSRNQATITFRLGKVPKTDLYLDLSTYPEAREIPEICIFRITGAIHYANTDQVKKFIIEGTGLDAKMIYLEKLEKEAKITIKQISMVEKNNGLPHNDDPSIVKVKYLVLDLSGLSYVDASGGKFLEQIRSAYEKADIQLCIAGLSERVLDKMQRISCLAKFPASHLFHSVHDAIVILTDL